MNIISDNDKCLIFSLILLYANDARSVIIFSMVSKISCNMIKNHFKKFRKDCKENDHLFVDFYDHLSIPINVWYALLEKITIDKKYSYTQYFYDYRGGITNFSYEHKKNYDKNFWPIKKLSINDEIDLCVLSKMRELRSLDLHFNIPNLNDLNGIKLCNKLTSLKLHHCNDIDTFPVNNI